MTDERKDAIDLIIKDRIMNTKDVETITSFESEFDMRTRTYTMICNISTSYGEIEDLKINKSFQFPAISPAFFKAVFHDTFIYGYF